MRVARAVHHLFDDLSTSLGLGVRKPNDLVILHSFYPKIAYSFSADEEI